MSDASDRPPKRHELESTLSGPCQWMAKPGEFGPQRGPSSVSRIEAQVKAVKREMESQPDAFTQRTRQRLESGEAHVLCRDCGAKLWSDAGHQDRDIPCPYMRHGKCDPK